MRIPLLKCIESVKISYVTNLQLIKRYYENQGEVSKHMSYKVAYWKKTLHFEWLQFVFKICDTFRKKSVETAVLSSLYYSFQNQENRNVSPKHKIIARSLHLTVSISLFISLCQEKSFIIENNLIKIFLYLYLYCMHYNYIMVIDISITYSL